MSQPELTRILRDVRPSAPPELRERVRLVAAQARPPRPHLVTWRRAILVAAAAAVAVVAGVLATRPAHRQAQPVPAEYHAASRAGGGQAADGARHDPERERSGAGSDGRGERARPADRTPPAAPRSAAREDAGHRDRTTDRGAHDADRAAA